MRKLFLNPVTCLAATIASFYILRGVLGPAGVWYRAMLLILAFGYGCNLLFLAVFRRSDWWPVMKKLRFPEANRDRMFLSLMGYCQMMLRTLIGSAWAIAFGVSPASVVSFVAALMVVATFGATLALMRVPASA